MKLTNIIAIDCGASFLKAALFYDGKFICNSLHTYAGKIVAFK